MSTGIYVENLFFTSLFFLSIVTKLVFVVQTYCFVVNCAVNLYVRMYVAENLLRSMSKLNCCLESAACTPVCTHHTLVENWWNVSGFYFFRKNLALLFIAMWTTQHPPVSGRKLGKKFDDRTKTCLPTLDFKWALAFTLICNNNRTRDFRSSFFVPFLQFS